MPLNKHEAASKLEQLSNRAKDLVTLSRGNQDFNKWRKDAEITIKHIFGEDSKHFRDFVNISYAPLMLTSGTPNDSFFMECYQNGMNNAITLIDSLIDEVKDFWKEEPELGNYDLTAVGKVEILIRRFHNVARQLRSRYNSRETLQITDEHDVQDLFHAILRIYFDDIRAEDYVPTYAGAASRVDFLLKEEKIVIEIKKTRPGLAAKEIGEQLIIDSLRYKSHPDCSQFICFVYDPGGIIVNPRGIEKDLSKDINGIPVVVFITPEQ